MRILQTEHLAEAPAAWLAERHELVRGTPSDPAIAAQLSTFDAMVIRTYTEINADLLDQCIALKVIGRAGVGLDQVDLDACSARGVRVVHTPDANTQAVVEYVMTLTCNAMRPRVRLQKPIDAEEWNALRAQTVGVRQVADCTIGILGLGRIGSRLARAFGALGADVVYNDLLEIPEAQRFGATPVEVDELFRRADVLTIHIDGRATNRGFVNAERLAYLRPDALLINTSRGMVINESALVDVMKQRPDARAILDVHAAEPIPAEAPTWNLPNVELYPHLAARTEQAMLNMSWVVRDVDAVLRGDEPAHAAC